MKEYTETITSLIKLLRPKYYNIISKLIILAGIALISKPFWVELLNILFVKIDIPQIGENDWAIGLVLIVIALIYNTINHLFELKHNTSSQPAFQNVSYKSFISFGELCQEIYPILKDNEYIFKTIGPNSGSEEEGILRTDLTLWHKLKKESILPNNEAIKELITKNKNIIPTTYKEIFNKMLIHIEAFREHIINATFDYSEHQFPQEFQTIITTTSYETSKQNRKLQQKTTWLMQNLKIDDIVNWYIFGSVLFNPVKANDIDLIILLKGNIADQNGTIKKIEQVRQRFRQKFKKELHTTIFDDKTLNDYQTFTSKNPLRIDK